MVRSRDDHFMEDDSILDFGFRSYIIGVGPPYGAMGSGGAWLRSGLRSKTLFGLSSNLGFGSFMGNHNPFTRWNNW
jgi:hypothetical protein